MISNRCARKSLVTNCNSIISKNYLRFLVDSNGLHMQIMAFVIRAIHKHPALVIIAYMLEYRGRIVLHITVQRTVGMIFHKTQCKAVRIRLIRFERRISHSHLVFRQGAFYV